MQFQSSVHIQREMENWDHYVDNEDMYFFIGDLED